MTTPPTIRTNPDGTIDEVITAACDLHIEDMGEGVWSVQITQGDRYWMFALAGAGILVESSEDESRAQ
jgi:hypothetical protein